MNTFYLNITASDKVFYADHCKALVIPLADGEKEVLPHHENMIIAISTGEMRLQKPDGQWLHAVVGNGVKMLVDTAELPEDIDLRRAQEAKERAEEQLRQKQSIVEHSHSEASLARALTRLRIKEKYV